MAANPEFHQQLLGGPVKYQQLKQTGARSAGRREACNDFILTASVHSMLSGDLARYNLDMARSWEEDDSVLSTN
jgi:hypothetical protein